MLVRVGTLDEALQVLRGVGELGQGRTHATHMQHLAGRRHLVLVAEQGGELVGFKVGYALDRRRFYGWVGGIHPAHRRQGIAQALLETQQRWAAAQGYDSIEVKTSQDFPQIVALLERNGYQPRGEAEGKLRYRRVL